MRYSPTPFRFVDFAFMILPTYAICRKSYDTKLDSRISLRVSLGVRSANFSKPIRPDLLEASGSRARPKLYVQRTFGECGPDVGTSMAYHGCWTRKCYQADQRFVTNSRAWNRRVSTDPVKQG